jgi:hypothetical protein
MNNLLPCPLSVAYILLAGGLGFLAGCMHEQLRMVEIFKPGR